MQLRFITGENATLASLMCRDAGPEYAKSLLLPCSGVSSLRESATGDALLIDNNLTAGEVGIVQEIIERQQAPGLLKVVDPYWVRGHSGRHKSDYVRKIETHRLVPNVGLLSRTSHTEWSQLVAEKF